MRTILNYYRLLKELPGKPVNSILIEYNLGNETQSDIIFRWESDDSILLDTSYIKTDFFKKMQNIQIKRGEIYYDSNKHIYLKCKTINHKAERIDFFIDSSNEKTLSYNFRESQKLNKVTTYFFIDSLFSIQSSYYAENTNNKSFNDAMKRKQNGNYFLDRTECVIMIQAIKDLLKERNY
jgi:hypothetical protein